MSTCPVCNGYLMPVGDGTNAVCAASIDGKCEAGRLVPNPGERECLNAYLRQMLPVAVWDKSAKQWKLADGTAVGRGIRCRTKLGWNELQFRGKPTAQFGRKRQIRLIEAAPVRLTKAEREAKQKAAKEHAEKIVKQLSAT